MREVMKQAEVKEALDRKFPEPVVTVISCDRKGTPNIMPVGWSTQVSVHPPMWAIVINKENYTHQLILESRQFVVIFPSKAQKEAIRYCGSHSGKEVNKFDYCGLKKIPAQKVRPPLIKDCVAALECKLVNFVESGDHTIFVGTIVAAHISERHYERLYNFRKKGSDVLKTVSEFEKGKL